ncbi:hypothetical protein [Candidatus Igneacidithiobacillus taiwanensis]|uniref:hypothetical protein n=1 Tax=Candidatus Igneacidithiobacillus taiwanensis TaxID=1945924 RepID=UPI00289F9413|nr:hypothetical protein [Candidatus Igneacidithiobacillus taiwanensis]
MVKHNWEFFFRKRLKKLEELIHEFATSPVVFSDPRVKYVEIQVSREALEEAQKLIGLYPSREEKNND